MIIQFDTFEEVEINTVTFQSLLNRWKKGESTSRRDLNNEAKSFAVTFSGVETLDVAVLPKIQDFLHKLSVKTITFDNISDLYFVPWEAVETSGNYK